MTRVVASWVDDDGAPLTTPATTPTLRIRRADTGALVVTDAAMVEIGGGSFGYEFAEDATLDYTVRADGDPASSGQVNSADRYQYGSISGPTEARIGVDIPAIRARTDGELVDVATFLGVVLGTPVTHTPTTVVAGGATYAVAVVGSSVTITRTA
jgi:hypothetical protein